MGVRPSFVATEQVVSSTVMRFDAGTVLSRLESAGLLAQGRVHLVSVDAIRTAFGARWDSRKALVWDMTEALIMKSIGDRDFTARLSDVDFAVITPKLEQDDAQALAVRISRKILTHFLGDSSASDITVKIVTSYREQTICCERISDGALQRAIATVGSGKAKVAVKASDDVGVVSTGAVMAINGRRLRFSTYIDPIIDLNHWAVAGHRIEPRVAYEDTGVVLSADARRRLLPRDVEAFDMTTLAKGLERLMAVGNGAKSTIILTVSFLSVSNTKARTALLELAKSAKAEMVKSVIWEITDFDAGVPSGLLHDCIALLQPFSRAVFARAEAGTLAAISERSAGRCGLVFQPAEEFEEDDEENAASSWLLSTSRIAIKRSATLIAANLPSKSLLPMACSVGFTHATVRTPHPI